ncbi:MAG: hypothetical protein WDZ41_05710 [Candidatus Babeliales bacterium]
MKYAIKFMIALVLITSSVNAGVYLLSETPEGFINVIKQNQAVISKELNHINNQAQNKNYLFQPAQFSPHLSLAFVSQDQINIEQTKEKYPRFIDELRNIAAQSKAIDITQSVDQMSIDYWQGKFEIEYDGVKKKNYLNVVLKLANNPELIKLANRIGDLLKEKYQIEQRFPFGAHFTLGRICEQNDDQSTTDLGKMLSNKEKLVDTFVGSILLDSFVLKGHDGSEEIFKLQN